MVCSATAFWVPMASMVMMAPWISTNANNSGMAVISLDFSAQATGPQQQAELTGPDTRCMQSAQAVGVIVAAPGCLAVHGQDRLVDAAGRGRLGAQDLQPIAEADLKLRRVE